MTYRVKVTFIEVQARRVWPYAKFVKDDNDVYMEVYNAEFAELLEAANKALEKSLKQ